MRSERKRAEAALDSRSSVANVVDSPAGSVRVTVADSTSAASARATATRHFCSSVSFLSTVNAEQECQASSGTSRLPFVNAATRSPRIPRSLTTLASVSSSAGKPFTGKRKSLATRIPTIVGVAAGARPTMRANAQPPRRGSIDSYPVGVYGVCMTEHHGYTPQKDALARRMKRIEGQVRGIGKMIDDDKYCIDILTQVSAATAALHAVSINLLEEHIAHCVVDAAGSGDDEAARKKIEEASAAIARLIKS